MPGTLFPEFLGRAYDAAVTKYYDVKNDPNTERPYTYPSLFPEEYSVDGRWASTSVANVTIIADIVSLDSSIPLKRRDKIESASGFIPKMGLKYALNENEMRNIQILKGLGKNDKVVDVLYKDTGRVISGVQEMLEYQSLQAFSTGTVLLLSDGNDLNGVRVDFDIPADNRSVLNLPWSNVASDPIEDIKENMIKSARNKGVSIRYIHMGYDKAQEFLRNPNVIEFYGNFLNFIGTNIPRPTLEKANESLVSEGFQIIVHDRWVNKEAKDGTRTAVNCWDNKMVVGTVSNSGIGKLIHTDLAEEDFKAKQVTYNKAGSFILVSKFHKIDPIREFTKSEASAMPVLMNVAEMYYLDTEELLSSSDAQTEGDANISIDGNTVTVAALVTALKAVGMSKAKTSNTDATLQKYFNDLNAADEATVRTALGI